MTNRLPQFKLFKAKVKFKHFVAVKMSALVLLSIIHVSLTLTETALYGHPDNTDTLGCSLAVRINGVPLYFYSIFYHIPENL